MKSRKPFMIRLDEHADSTLRKLAAKNGMTRSAVVRVLIRRAGRKLDARERAQTARPDCPEPCTEAS